MAFKRIICIDFDGVIHSYKSGWKGPLIVADEPVEGAIKWLKELVESEDFDPQIYSSRSKEPGGIETMKRWLQRNGLIPSYIRGISFPKKKPAAFLTIDDRAICFNGTFPTQQEMKDFKPWNKKEV